MFTFYIVFEISGTLSRHTTNTSLNFVYFANLNLLTMKQKAGLDGYFYETYEKGSFVLSTRPIFMKSIR